MPVVLLLALLVAPAWAQRKPGPNAPVTPTANSARDLVEQANAALKAGDEIRAVKLFEQARAMRDFPTARPGVGLILAVGDAQASAGTQQAFDGALATYATINDSPVATSIDRALARIKRAEVFLRQDKATAAKEEINAIRGISQSRRTLLMADLGDALIQLHLGQAEGARDRLLPLLESDEPILQAMAMFSLGRAYVQLKQPDQAVTVFKKLWNKYGETVYVKRAVFLVGGIYLDRGDFMEARKLFEACSVIGAAMQSRVQPGDELIIKVSDPNYFARTRSAAMPVTVRVPSGDIEIVKLDKNPVSDVLYTGRIQTALADSAKSDGTLQVRGSDEIEMTYEGQVATPRKVLVVDDGRINVDSVPIADPPPRNAKPAVTLAPAKRKAADEGEEVKPILPTGRQAAGSLNPGSPVYVQVVDADLDKSDQADTLEAQVLAHGARADSTPVNVTLKETGPRTGVFAGSVPTAQGVASVAASSEAVGHPATAAVDVDSASPAPAAKVDQAKARAKTTYWKGKPGEKSFWIEIDLRQPAFLGKLIWGHGTDPLAEKTAPTAMSVTVRGDNVEKTIALSGKGQPIDNATDLGGLFARTIHIEITKWDGDAPSLGQLIVLDATGAQLVPTGVDPEANSKQGVLAFDVGQTVSARYLDDENETPGTPTVRQSRRLGASYHNASINVATKGEGKNDSFSPMWRLTLAAEPFVVLTDPDMDTTVNPDKLTLDVFSEAGGKRSIELTETGPATGTFAAALPVTENAAAKDDARLLYVRRGDLVWFNYLDERNMAPGYRTFRGATILENRPTAGELAPLVLLQTAWPYQVTGEGAEAPMLERSASDGRLTIGVHDPEALGRSGQTVGVKAAAMLSGTGLELTLSAGSGGSAARTLDLTLGDKDVERNVEGKSSSELSVAGDDIIRIAYNDANVATSDLQRRRAYSEDELKGQEKLKPLAAEAASPVLPLIVLKDPQRRIGAEQDARLKALKEELGGRLAGYAEEGKLLAARRDLLKSRLGAPRSGEPDVNQVAADDAIKASIAALEAQLQAIEQRNERLRAMGGVAGERPVKADAPAQAASETDKAKSIQEGPLTPGQPFEISIEDADLTAAEVDVRVRSVAGRLVDVLTIKAQRDPGGTYKAKVETERGGDAGDPKLLSLMPGGEVIVDYTDPVQKDPGAVDRVTYVALASDGRIEVMNPNFAEVISEIRLGEAVHIQVTDFDQDRTPAQDRITITAKSATGDTLNIICTETEAHSGMFRGVFVTDRGQANAGDDILQTDYGSSVEVAYADYLRVSPGADAIRRVSLKVSGGADGIVEGFNRQFRDAKDEMQLWYRTGQAAYQLGRKLYLNHSIERAEENFAEATDYFTQLVNRFPEDPLAASSNYYLGNIQSLKQNHAEALARFQDVVARWPKSEYVARARFKIGQSYEAMGQFEQAADAYVLLTYHHPEDGNVPTAMIRMMNYYARQEAWTDAVAIAEKFVEKFPDHSQAGQVALKAGQWLAVAERINEALAWFSRAEKVFATKDKEMPALLYWHAATLISSNKGQLRGNAPRAEKVRELLNRVVYDYPSNEFVPMAKIALEQMAERK